MDPNNYLCEACGLSCDGSFINSKSSNGQYDDKWPIIQKMKRMLFPLIEKDKYFICQYCEAIISEICTESQKSYVNLHSKSNLKPGRTQDILKVSTIESEYWTHEEELPIHQLALSKFCRVCKSRKFDHVRNENYYHKNSELILKVCKLLSNENFEEEDPNIYPTHLCHKCFLLFTKNCTSLLINQPANKISCASFPSHKINCEICSTLTEKDLAAIQTMKYMQSSSQWTHHEILRKLCRICGCFSGKRHIAKTSDMLQNCVLTLFNFKFENEDPNIYPFYVCNVCASKLNTFCYQKERNMQVSLPVLYEFIPHSEDCFICSRNVKSPDGKKNFVPYNTKALQNINIISTLYFHKQKLFRYCYICGIPNVLFYGKKIGKLICDIDVINKINFTVESSNVESNINKENVTPPAICHTCWIKLNINFNLKLKGKKSLIKHFRKFNFHTEKCSICSTSNYHLAVSEISLPYEKSDDNEKLEFLSYSSSVKSIEEILVKTIIKKGDVYEPVIIYGLPFDQLQVSEMTEAVACGGCAIVPLKPLLTKCHHVICEHCIKSIFEVSHICPHINCYQLVDPDKVWTSISKLAFIGSLTFICENSSCNFKGIMKDVIKHQLSCTGSNSLTLSHLTNILMKSSPIATKDSESSSLNEANIPDIEGKNSSLKKTAFKNVLPFINKFCDTHQQRKSDIFSFLADYYEENKNYLLSEDGDNASKVEETGTVDLEAKLEPVKAKKPKLSNSNQFINDVPLNVECNSLTSNVWDISSHDGQMSLLNGSIELHNRKIPLTSKRDPEENSSMSCSDLSQLSNSQCLKKVFGQDINLNSEQEDENHDSSNNLIIFEESVDDLSDKICPSTMKDNSSKVNKLYLHFSPHGVLPLSDDLLSESSSDQEFSDDDKLSES